jgi:hypothetical protein
VLHFQCVNPVLDRANWKYSASSLSYGVLQRGHSTYTTAFSTVSYSFVIMTSDEYPHWMADGKSTNCANFCASLFTS